MSHDVGKAGHAETASSNTRGFVSANVAFRQSDLLLMRPEVSRWDRRSIRMGGSESTSVESRTDDGITPAREVGVAGEPTVNV